ncbi:RHS repeat-associated core domain-containing protein [Nonomuraea solani]|uniref:RHS repeat-associated core domain-containing protein n=1 Tax=Nonomuraea solani TaxID=1144553 RepID=A0A1H6EHL9_9ACTN|nr:RHS repeat-associated core domain-containing protein [Nonomuraea solani]SEG96335.1 RHS repeat-associated core domain-containing protein [Nonomuraea solani]
MRRTRWQLCSITMLTCLFIMLMASTPAGATPAQIVDAMALERPVKPSKPDEVEPVPGEDFVPAAARPDPEAAPDHVPPARADWPEAGAAEVELSAPVAGRSAKAAKAEAGSLPVWVAATARPGPARVKIEVRDRATAEKAGVAGLLVSVRRTDGKAGRSPVMITVDYSAFKDAYGGDWASRLRLAPAPGEQTPVTAVRNDVKAGTVSAQVSVGDAPSTLALAAAADGSKGDYKATSLAPSGMWQVSTQSGDFSWSYPMDTPPVPGELEPDLALSYSSSAVDGRTVSTNNQPSWVGEGWNLSPGFIERSYKGCADDLGGNNGTTKTGDLCWETDNATMAFGEQSGRLIFENDVWRPQADDGTRVERAVRNDPQVNGDDDGEYWKVTTTDGTQYFFGLNRLPGSGTTQSTWTVPVYGNDTGEPCRAATFAASACQQAYRWNLDYVVDAHGNSMSYFYTPESNKYAQNMGQTTGTYVRGGTLARIEYGTRAGAESAGSAPARVVFGPADRCVPGSTCATHNDANIWPDVPWDTECTTATCGTKYSPTFWSTQRLAKITTQISTGNGNYRSVDQWDLAHTYPPANDGSGDKALWLNGITHTGLAGTAITLPAVTFDATMLPNRVNAADDGLPPLNKPRLTKITSESGGAIDVTYARPDCASGTRPVPETNTKRCFPQRWAMPPATEPVNDWFHKYVVARVTQDDQVGDAKDMVTNYDYDTAKGGAWAYDDNPLTEEKKRTWSEWRGYDKVTVRQGDPANDENKPESKTEYLYFRGMHGDRLNPTGGTKPVEYTDSTGATVADVEPLAGFQRQEITYDGATPLTTGYSDPWIRLTATQGGFKAHQVEVKRREIRERRSSTTFRTTQVETTYDEYGNATQVNDFGDIAGTGDDQCTITTYVHDAAKMLVTFPSTTKTVGVACGKTPSYPDDAISDTKISYDGQDFGKAPLKGDVTKSEVAKSYTGATATYMVQSTASFDDLGRVKETKDALNRTTTTSYAETNGLTTAATVTKVAAPENHVETTTIDPARGHPTKQVDAAGRATSLIYDALGRLTKVYKPGRTEANGDPHVRYDYGVNRTGGPNWIRTRTLRANGNLVDTYELFDGFQRPRQTQQPSPGGGRILTDSQYDTRGLVSVNRPVYHATGDPGTTLYSLTSTEAGKLPPATVTTYDGAERKTAEIYFEHNSERWRTTTSYSADWVSEIPPEGGTVTTKWIDARDRMTALVQYRGRTLTSPNDVTRYGYTKAGQLATVTDAALNVWRYHYDALGRRIRAEDPDRGVSTMTYDDAGQLKSVTDARGKTIVSLYDDLGRVAQTRLGSETGTLLTKNVYDTLAKGALTSSTRYVNGQAYSQEVTGYDTGGRPQGTSVTIPAAENQLAGTYTTSLTYRVDGSLATKALPELGDLPAETIVYDYNDLGRSKTMTGKLTYVTDTTYTALGETAQMELGTTDKRLWRTTNYEEGTRRLTESLTERDKTDNGAGTVVNDLTYDYDFAGNVTRITDRTAGSQKDSQCFTVDYLRRVTAAWTQDTDTCAATPSASLVGGPAPYWHQYDYDAIGNRKTKTVKGLAGAADTVTGYSYPNSGAGAVRPHAVANTTTNSTTMAYGYDASGNTISRPGPTGLQTLTWNDEGLLASITAAGKTTSYVYDAIGQQLIRRDPGATTLFAGEGELRLNTATGSTTGTRYYDGLGTRTGDGFTWTVDDHHGTSQLAIDAQSLATTTRRMDLFGNLRGTNSEWPAGSRGFVSGTANPETGLTRLGAREYDPMTGKFLSADPVIDPFDPQQMNAYAYSNNNPATMTDPDGLRYNSRDNSLKKALRASGNKHKKRTKQLTKALRKSGKEFNKRRNALNKRAARAIRASFKKDPYWEPNEPPKEGSRPWWGWWDTKIDASNWDWDLGKLFRSLDWLKILRNFADSIRPGLEALWNNRGKILGTLGFILSVACAACRAVVAGLTLIGIADGLISCGFKRDMATCGGAAISILTAGLGVRFGSSELGFDSELGEAAVASVDLALAWGGDLLFGEEENWHGTGGKLDTRPLKEICEKIKCGHSG